MTKWPFAPSPGSGRYVAAVLAASLVPLALAPFPPLQDLPDWAFQARIWNDIGRDASGLAAHYEIVGLPVPNSVVTIAMAYLARCVGYVWAAKSLAMFTAIFFALAFVRFVRASRRDYAPGVELLGAFFAVGHFFWMGFLNFQLGLAVAFCVLADVLNGRGAPIPHRAARTAIGLVACWFCHFLAFAALLVALAGLVFDRHRFRPGAYARLALAALPSLALLVWYASARAGDFFVGYRYANPVKWLWYKIGPFAVATGFYPVTSPGTQWVVAAINVLATLALGAIVLVALVRLVRDRSPLRFAVLALIAVGLVAPTRFFEVIRPGERWLFFGVLLVLAAAPGFDLSPRWTRRTAMALVVVSLLSGVQALGAGFAIRRYVEGIERAVPPGATMLVVSDSHFHFREERPWAEKARDPYSWPNWVSALKFAPNWNRVRSGGYAPELFPSGLVRPRPRDLPPLGGLSGLGEAAATAPYDAIVASGIAPNLRAIESAARANFAAGARGRNFVVLTRANRSP
ncbi:MAG: hypothetical protein IT350_09755 [Deltaproteobacteria bacterium]|nr:hypothetical protein [Deltaproteobacteria bacterium]